MRFFESLTKIEKAALSHMTMSYLDDQLPENWDDESERVSHPIEIDNQIIDVQGFKKPFFELKTYNLKNNGLDLDVDSLIYLSRLASYRVSENNEDFELQKESYGTMLANQTSGMHNLFDHPVLASHFISLEINDARVSGRYGGEIESGEAFRVYGEKNTVTISLAPEQYVRFVRSQSAKVPCTISRRGGYLNDEPSTDYLTASKEAAEVKSHADDVVKPLIELTEKLSDLMGSGKVASSKRFAEVYEFMDLIEQQFEECIGSIEKTQVEAVYQIKYKFFQKMIDQVQLEVKALPVNRKKEFMILLENMGSDL